MRKTRTQAMQVIALVTEKGGTGKTTLAVNLAVAAAAAASKVLLVDLDEFGSTHIWFEIRKTAHPAFVALPSGSFGFRRRLAETLETAWSEGYDLVVLDVPRYPDAYYPAMEAADLCLIVTTPSGVDLQVQAGTVDALQKLGKQAAFVLNQCDTHRTRAAAARSGPLAQYPYPTLRATTSKLLAYQRAYAKGRGVSEIKGPAATEVQLLWLEVQSLLGTRAKAA